MILTHIETDTHTYKMNKGAKLRKKMLVNNNQVFIIKDNTLIKFDLFH